MLSCFATLAVVCSLSPLSNITFTPSFCNCLIAFAEEGFIGSDNSMNPALIPLIPTQTFVDSLFANSSNPLIEVFMPFSLRKVSFPNAVTWPEIMPEVPCPGSS